MALARIVLGGEIDVCTSEEMDGFKSDILDGIHKNKPSDKRFIDRPLSGSGVAPASGNLVVELYPQGPAVGRIWNLTALVVLGGDDHTAVTGVTVSWYIGDSSNPILGQCIKPAMTVPQGYEFSKDVVWQQPGSQLFGIVYGATAGQQIVLNAKARDFRQSDIVEQVI